MSSRLIHQWVVCVCTCVTIILRASNLVISHIHIGKQGNCEDNRTHGKKQTLRGGAWRSLIHQRITVPFFGYV